MNSPLDLDRHCANKTCEVEFALFLTPFWKLQNLVDLLNKCFHVLDPETPYTSKDLSELQNMVKSPKNKVKYLATRPTELSNIC